VFYLLLAMLSEQYEVAKRLYDDTTEHEGFVLLPNDRKERWKIFNLYLEYILNFTQSPLYKPKKKDYIRSFRHLLSEVPTYSRDKKGYNVSILIIHILFLLEKKDLDGIALRMEALRTYRQRYLQPKTSRQSAMFFKLLHTMERHSFDYEKTLRYSAIHFDRLKSTPSDYVEYEEALQILPFDWLWPHILDRLKKLKAQATRRRVDQNSNVPDSRAS
jgi:hypothetical protein